VFERFTERARQVVVFAQEEARDLKHNYIGTEHILLGLLRDRETGLVASVFRQFGITLEQAREEVAKIIGEGEEATAGQMPFTPRAKKVLELSLREALSLGHNYISTEHVLLGLVREGQGVASRILADFGATPDLVRSEVIGRLRAPTEMTAAPQKRPDRSRGGWQREAVLAGWLLFGVAAGIGLLVGWLIWG
jgi:ATP-dependent Clp protease ATP-binding subunit ClpC